MTLTEDKGEHIREHIRIEAYHDKVATWKRQGERDSSWPAWTNPNGPGLIVDLRLFGPDVALPGGGFKAGERGYFPDQLNRIPSLPKDVIADAATSTPPGFVLMVTR